jgi:hypothetical protein
MTLNGLRERLAWEENLAAQERGSDGSELLPADPRRPR